MIGDRCRCCQISVVLISVSLFTDVITCADAVCDFEVTPGSSRQSRGGEWSGHGTPISRLGARRHSSFTRMSSSFVYRETPYMHKRMTKNILCHYAYYFIDHSNIKRHTAWIVIHETFRLGQCHTSAAAACGAADAGAAQQADDGVDEAGQSVPHTSNNGDLPDLSDLSDDRPVTRTILTLAVTLPLLYLPIFFLLLWTTTFDCCIIWWGWIIFFHFVFVETRMRGTSGTIFCIL